MFPGALAAQDIPPYVPVNPVLASRSPLYAQPYLPTRSGWHLRAVMDYSNAVEVDESPDTRFYTFDAEVLETDFWLTHDLSSHAFVIGDLPLRGGYNGFLDGFLNWYHKVIGLPVPARETDPHNTFIWNFTLPGPTNITRSAPGTFLGDARVGGGLRFGGLELLGMVTLPTTTTGEDGWGRKVVSSSLAASGELLHTSRWLVDAEVTAGWTPTTGALAAYQRSVFAGGFLSARWRFAGEQALYSTFWTQSDNWQNTGWDALDTPEVTMDFGALLRLKRNWPEVQVGATEDLIPKGPAVDIGFKFGLRW